MYCFAMLYKQRRVLGHVLDCCTRTKPALCVPILLCIVSYSSLAMSFSHDHTLYSSKQTYYLHDLCMFSTITACCCLFLFSLVAKQALESIVLLLYIGETYDYNLKLYCSTFPMTPRPILLCFFCGNLDRWHTMCQGFWMKKVVSF